MIKAIFFDLFFTLITPTYDENANEYSLLGIPMEKWEEYAEEASIYEERALGQVENEQEIIERIVARIPFEVSNEQKKELLCLREKRMRRALTEVPNHFLGTLKRIHDKGIKAGIISNADLIDKKYWNESALRPFFDDAVFSCDVGILKPDPLIYNLAMERLGVLPQECVFVGDGGSNELFGARRVGMKTILSEVLDVKNEKKRRQIMKDADYCISEFQEILKCLDDEIPKYNDLFDVT